MRSSEIIPSLFNHSKADLSVPTADDKIMPKSVLLRRIVDEKEKRKDIGLVIMRIIVIR